MFPNEDLLDRIVCCIYSNLNRNYADRVQRDFTQASVEILQMFEQPDPLSDKPVSENEAA